MTYDDTRRLDLLLKLLNDGDEKSDPTSGNGPKRAKGITILYQQMGIGDAVDRDLIDGLLRKIDDSTLQRAILELHDARKYKAAADAKVKNLEETVDKLRSGV